jgi:hypothetical protein
MQRQGKSRISQCFFHLGTDKDRDHNGVVRVLRVLGSRLCGLGDSHQQVPPVSGTLSEQSHASKRSPHCRSCGAVHGVGPPACAVTMHRVSGRAPPRMAGGFPSTTSPTVLGSLRRSQYPLRHRRGSYLCRASACRGGLAAPADTRCYRMIPFRLTIPSSMHVRTTDGQQEARKRGALADRSVTDVCAVPLKGKIAYAHRALAGGLLALLTCEEGKSSEMLIGPYPLFAASAPPRRSETVPGRRHGALFDRGTCEPGPCWSPSSFGGVPFRVRGRETLSTN